MIDLSTLDFEDVVVESYHLDYSTKVGSIFIDLQGIKQNLYLVEKVVQLPFRVIYADDPNMLFFTSFVNNALDINIMTINRLITNTGSMNLLRFRNSLLKEIHPTYQKAYRERLKNTQLDPNLKSIIDDMIWRRNEMIAHNEDISLWAGDMTEYLLGGQKKLYAAMERAFQAVIFKESTIKATFEPEDIEVDTLLDLAARNSKLINMPEQDNGYWQKIKGSLEQSLIDKINHYRSKFGLPSV